MHTVFNIPIFHCFAAQAAAIHYLQTTLHKTTTTAKQTSEIRVPTAAPSSTTTPTTTLWREVYVPLKSQ